MVRLIRGFAFLTIFGIGLSYLEAVDPSINIRLTNSVFGKMNQLGFVILGVGGLIGMTFMNVYSKRFIRKIWIHRNGRKCLNYKLNWLELNFSMLSENLKIRYSM